LLALRAALKPISDDLVAVSVCLLWYKLSVLFLRLGWLGYY